MKTRTNLLSKKYAEALSEVLFDFSVIEELDLLKEVFLSSNDLRNLLSNPSVKLQAKKNLLKLIFDSRLSKPVMDLVLLLVEKRRTNLLPCLVEEYHKIFYSNQELAKIYSAKALNQNELGEIKECLERIFDKNIRIEVFEDIDLIAGLQIFVAGKLIDTSLKNKVKNLKELLGV